MQDLPRATEESGHTEEGMILDSLVEVVRGEHKDIRAIGSRRQRKRPKYHHAQQCGGRSLHYRPHFLSSFSSLQELHVMFRLKLKKEKTRVMSPPGPA